MSLAREYGGTEKGDEYVTGINEGQGGTSVNKWYCDKRLLKAVD